MKKHIGNMTAPSKNNENRRPFRQIIAKLVRIYLYLPLQ